MRGFRDGQWLATLVCTTLVWWLSACGGPPTDNQGATEGGADASAGVGGEGGATASGSGGAVSTASAGATSGSGGSASTGSGSGGGMADLGALVVLGDSISDGGGEGPFYYDVLLSDLEAHYGKTLSYENHAQSGSTTLFLEGQIDNLPAELPGPVAIVFTSGGNNMQYNVLQVLTGTDQMARDRMGEHIDAALTELLTPGRFGSGVMARVFEANVYDASDGQGNFGSNGCAMPLDAPDGTLTIFANWNGVIGDAVAAHGQTLVDFHSHFAGHGFNSPAPSWYAADCVHPNSAGHAEISGLVFSLITGS